MKTSEERDAMVARVQAAHAKWPALEKMPDNAELSKGAAAVAVDVKKELGDAAYVSALYELSHKGATPIGRSKDGKLVVGELIEAPQT